MVIRVPQDSLYNWTSAVNGFAEVWVSSALTVGLSRLVSTIGTTIAAAATTAAATRIATRRRTVRGTGGWISSRIRIRITGRTSR